MNIIGTFKKLNLKTATVLKIAGVALLVIVVAAVALRLLGSSFNSVFKQGGASLSVLGQPAYDTMQAYEEKSLDYGVGNTASLSLRNVQPSPIIPGSGTVGDDAEEFEVTQYNGQIETRHLKDTCKTFTDLKAKDYVIFENASQSDHSCNYTFKVKNDNVAEILVIVKALDPKELSENTYTIKQLVNDFTSETEILEKKLASIDETLSKAINAYDNVTSLATRVQDVESLAKIIDSKLNIIERLTQERLNINSQLDRLQRSKAEQLDRLEYTYFYLNIIEDRYIDLTSLKDSWQAAIKEFVRDVNGVAQDITVNLAVLLFYLLQYAIYFFILLLVAKYGWQLAKYIWKK
ncbi:MAG: hypothetical protein WC675_05395 [Patescibacteria group bacterium]|jgi:hypothetical protein